MIFTKPVNEGWVCPLCGCVMAPFISNCLGRNCKGNPNNTEVKVSSCPPTDLPTFNGEDDS